MGDCPHSLSRPQSKNLCRFFHQFRLSPGFCNHHKQARCPSTIGCFMYTFRGKNVLFERQILTLRDGFDARADTAILKRSYSMPRIDHSFSVSYGAHGYRSPDEETMQLLTPFQPPVSPRSRSISRTQVRSGEPSSRRRSKFRTRLSFAEQLFAGPSASF